VIPFVRTVPSDAFDAAYESGPVAEALHKNATEPSDDELARSLAEGDMGAVDTLLERYWEPLIRYAYRLVEDRAAAEDVVQDTFLRVWTGRMKSSKGPVRAYLYRVSRNLALDELRRRRARSKRELRHGSTQLTAPQTPVDVLQNKRLQAAVNAAIQALPERRREAFTLVYLRALSYAEVSEIMGISQKTLGNHISAALSELRQALRPLLAEVDLDNS
jgi:RNA polymerase sigma-70 factor, ECF subfamily